MKKLLILLLSVCTTNGLMSQTSENKDSNRWDRGIEVGVSHWIKFNSKDILSLPINYFVENRLNKHWSVKVTGGLFSIDNSSMLAVDAGIEPRYYFTSPNKSKLNWFVGIPANGYFSLADGEFDCKYFVTVSPVIGAKSTIGNRFFIEGALGATFIESLDRNTLGDSWFSNLSIKLGYTL
jgi:hypothetical protein